MRLTRPGARTLNPSPVTSGRLSRELEHRAEPVERIEVEWGPQGDVDLICAGIDVLADPVEHFFVRPREAAVPGQVGDLAELGLKALFGPCQPDVDRAADLGRIASDSVAVLVEDA